jgi:hypothetical protein
MSAPLLEALARVVQEVELRSSLSPTVRVQPAALGQPGGKPSRLAQWLRPTLVVRTTAGEEYTLAPHGAAPGGNAGGVLLATLALGVLGAAVGAGYLLGRSTK